MGRGTPTGSGARSRWQEASLSLGSAILVMILAVVLAQSLVLVVGGAVNVAATLIGVVAGVGWLWWVRRDASVRERLALTVVLAVVVAAVLVIAAITVDVTWDGNAYHKLAIGELRAGWNPVYSSAEEFNALPSTRIHLTPDTWLWVDRYPKASWIFGASIAQLFSSMATARAFGLLITIAVGLIAAGYLASRLGPIRGTVIAALLLCNPVAMAQILSDYVDGPLGNLIVISMVVLTMLLDPGFRPPRWWKSAQWVTLAAALVLMVNLKFTGLVFAGFIGIVYVVALLVRGRAHRRAALALLATGAAAAVVSLGLVGASSYVRNWIVAGNPLSPLLGAHTADVLEIGGEPAFVKGMNRFSAFVLSNLSSSTSSGDGAHLKIPFTFTLDELKAFDWVDVRIGGYGVLFGGILLVSVVLSIIAVARLRRRLVPFLPLALAPIVIVLLNVGLVDGSWWARYVPELCAVPILAAVAIWPSGGRVVKALAWVLLGVTALNVLWIMASQLRQQVIEWPDPPLAQQVAAGGCKAVYPGTTFTGLAFDAADAVPGVTILSKSEYVRLGPARFVAATPRVWLVHPLLIETGC